jgi:hypothetical protein
MLFIKLFIVMTQKAVAATSAAHTGGNVGIGGENNPPVTKTTIRVVRTIELRTRKI